MMGAEMMWMALRISPGGAARDGREESAARYVSEREASSEEREARGRRDHLRRQRGSEERRFHGEKASRFMRKV